MAASSSRPTCQGDSSSGSRRPHRRRRRTMRGSVADHPGLCSIRRLVVVSAALCLAACAAKTPAALPTALKHPDFVYPAVAQELVKSPQATAIDRGWRYLQNDDLGAADREFSTALRLGSRLAPTIGVRVFAPAQAGLGWISLARGDYEHALTSFDMALTSDRDYVPAILGRAQSLLALKRDTDALAAFEHALAVDSSLGDV